jgi:hypothetical protein
MRRLQAERSQQESSYDGLTRAASNQPRHGSVAAAEAGAKRATGLLP